MPWYRTGTVSVTNNSTTVTGTGTDFSANSRVGDAFQGPDGRWYEVTNIASTTVISILPAYQGTTASGGVYGLAPMQGYVKQSADQLRAITNQYGTTLGILGTPSDATQLRTNIVAAKSGANSDITSITGLTTALSIAQGGTGGTSQATARTALGLGSAAVAPILGTVSQSGGVPTGALMEYVNNANGEAWKFANGLMITQRTLTTSSFSAAGSIFQSDAPAGNHPVAFAVSPKSFCADEQTASLWATGNTTALTVSARLFAVTSPGTVARNISVTCIGRWY